MRQVTCAKDVDEEPLAFLENFVRDDRQQLVVESNRIGVRPFLFCPPVGNQFS